MFMPKKLAETAEDDGHLVPFGYLKLIVEEIGTLGARSHGPSES